jgi:3'(2'), 5'-bisphosphate nucleotidase
MPDPFLVINTNLPHLLKLGLEAGKAILEVYATSFEVEFKNDHSPLTMADTRSHQILFEGLAQIGGFPILSEEMKEIPYKERKNWNTFWLVDPLDGTKEFIKRNGEFTVNIALIHDETPVFGLIYVPVTGIFYYALKRQGSYRLSLNPSRNVPDTHEEIIRLSEKLPVEHSQKGEYVIAVSRSHVSPKIEDYIRDKKTEYATVRTVSAGSSLKFCLVAEGKADVYPRFGPTMEWDTAAGQIIVTEAGKKLVCYDTMKPLLYNKPSQLNPFFLVY